MAIVAARMTMIWSRRSVVKMRLKVVIARPVVVMELVGEWLACRADAVTPYGPRILPACVPAMVNDQAARGVAKSARAAK